MVYENLHWQNQDIKQIVLSTHFDIIKKAKTSDIVRGMLSDIMERGLCSYGLFDAYIIHF